MSYTDIGKETGLSTSAAQQRVRRLEQRGVITGYRAVIDPTELGLMLTAFVSVTPFQPDQPDDAPELVKELPQVVSCYSVAGEANYLLKVQVSTTIELEKVLGTIRSISRVSTHSIIVLSTFYEDRPLV